MSQLNDLVIVYDGDCPFCTAYVRVTRLKKVFDRVLLVNAREDSAYLSEIRDIGLDLDEGMAVKYKNRWMHGDECIHFLALSSTGNGFLNGMIAWIFKSERRSKFFYPYLRCCRNMALLILGRERIKSKFNP